MKKKIIIFGSRGNLGKYITPYLKKRNLVFSPSSSDCNLKKLLSIDSFFKKIPNEKYIIIYLATKVSKNKNNLKNYNSNILMIKNLLKILKNLNLLNSMKVWQKQSRFSKNMEFKKLAF